MAVQHDMNQQAPKSGRMIREDNLPFFMIQNPSTTVAAEVTLSLIWQELPK